MLNEIEVSSQVTITDITPGTGDKNDQRDLTVLRYMGRRMYLTLCTEEVLSATTLPLRYILDECHNRKHRMLVYNPQALLQQDPLTFVGFVGGQQECIDPALEAHLQAVDIQMADALAHMPGFLGYSSLELRPGRWYNLVLLKDFDARSHLLNHDRHKHAAYELAPDYYEWIWLHSGLLQGGLNQGVFTLQRTKYFRFPGGLQSIVQKNYVS